MPTCCLSSLYQSRVCIHEDCSSSCWLSAREPKLDDHNNNFLAIDSILPWSLAACAMQQPCLISCAPPPTTGSLIRTFLDLRVEVPSTDALSLLQFPFQPKSTTCFLCLLHTALKSISWNMSDWWQPTDRGHADQVRRLLFACLLDRLWLICDFAVLCPCAASRWSSEHIARF